jgi:hypothetical protein
MSVVTKNAMLTVDLLAGRVEQATATGRGPPWLACLAVAPL